MSEPFDRPLGAPDLAAYLRLREASFGYPSNDPKVLAIFAQRLPTMLGSFVGDRLISALTSHPLKLFVAGRVTHASGFAAVATAPEHRRSGHVARLLQRALNEGRALGRGWNLLYPFDPAFYSRFGWVSIPTSIPLTLRPEQLPSGRAAGLLPIDPPAREALAACYARVAPGRTFADARDPAPLDPYPEFDGTPGERMLRYANESAWLVAQLCEGSTGLELQVIDLGWVDAPGRAAVMGTLAMFRGQVQRVLLGLPWDDPLVTDHQRNHPRAVQQAGLMVRVADVALALTPLRAVLEDDTPIELPPTRVRVVDAYCPWNDRVWRVVPGVSGSQVSPSDDPPEAVIDVRGLAWLISGAAAPVDLRRVGWAQGSARALATIAALAGGRRPYRSFHDAF